MSCVFGCGQPQPFAVVQLSKCSKKATAKDDKTQQEIDEELQKLVKESVNPVDPCEALQCVDILKEDWLPENGFLAPTQKIKRGAIEHTLKKGNVVKSGQAQGGHCLRLVLIHPLSRDPPCVGNTFDVPEVRNGTLQHHPQHLQG